MLHDIDFLSFFIVPYFDIFGLPGGSGHWGGCRYDSPLWYQGMSVCMSDEFLLWWIT